MELIKVDNDNMTTAKELYEFLDLRPGDYARWCNRNIESNKFAVEGNDYEVFRMDAENIAGRPSLNYRLSIDFAKKLCMISKSQRGEEARDYFIEVERRFKTVSQYLPQTFSESLRLLADTMDQKLALESKVAVMEPKAKAFDVFLDSKGYYSVGTAAKMIGMGRNGLYGLLRSRGIIMEDNVPYQASINAGYFAVKGNSTYVSPKGVQWLADKFVG